MAKKNNGGEKKAKGKVLISKDGTVTRYYPQPKIGTGTTSTYEKIDTTGYSKGKKGFAKESGYVSIGGSVIGPTVVGKKYGYEGIPRKDVLKEIEEMKKGSAGTTDFRNKKHQKESPFSKVKDIKVLKAIKKAALKVAEQKKKRKEKSEDGRPRKLKQLKGKQQF